MTKELKPLDLELVTRWLQFEFLPDHIIEHNGIDTRILAEAICQRFGQPAVPSAEKIEKIINDELDNPSNVRMDWQYQIATAIHNNLLRGAK